MEIHLQEGTQEKLEGNLAEFDVLDRLDPFLKEGIQAKLEGSLAEFDVWIVWIPS